MSAHGSQAVERGHSGGGRPAAVRHAAARLPADSRPCSRGQSHGRREQESPPRGRLDTRPRTLVLDGHGQPVVVAGARDLRSAQSKSRAAGARTSIDRLGVLRDDVGDGAAGDGAGDHLRPGRAPSRPRAAGSRGRGRSTALRPRAGSVPACAGVPVTASRSQAPVFRPPTKSPFSRPHSSTSTASASTTLSMSRRGRPALPRRARCATRPRRTAAGRRQAPPWPASATTSPPFMSATPGPCATRSPSTVIGRARPCPRRTPCRDGRATRSCRRPPLGAEQIR